jgi:hypothetical protein
MSKLFNPERMTPRERVLAKYPRAAAIAEGNSIVILANVREGKASSVLGVGGNVTWAWANAAKNIERGKDNG